MAQDTPLGFPAHTLPYRRGESTTFIDSFGHAACSALVIARRNDGRNRAYPARRLLSAAIPKSRASTAAKAAALRFPTGLIFFAR